MSKFLGFLLGIAVALVGPAMFGVLAADGGIKLNVKEMALAYGIGALIFWAVVSYFSGAAALGAALTFGAMIYTVHWIPNRMTNFLNDVPGVTTGMIDGIKQYTQNGVVPILAVISLVFGIQLIVQSVRKRRRERAEAERLQREQEAAVQAQQMPVAPAPYPVAGGDYQPDSRFGSSFGNNNYDDLFEEEPAPVQPRNQADEQTAQFAPAPYSEAEADETRLVPTDADETVMVPTSDPGKTVADGTEVAATPPQAAEPQEEEATQQTPVLRQEGAPEDAATQQAPVSEPEAPEPAEPQSEAPQPDWPQGGGPQAGGAQGGGAAGTAPQAGGAYGGVAPGGASPAGEAEQEATQQMPASEPEGPKPAAPQAGAADETATQQVPMGEPEAPKYSAPQDGAPQGGGPQGGAPQGGGPQGGAPQGAGPQAWVPQSGGPQGGPQASGVSRGGATVAPQVGRQEEVGQQYRERMDPPDVDDTGEFQLGAFESPGGAAPMELPGRFRPAGT
ncbi:hypothetical protein [Kribbella catacumbae]|uniref:hypothetical protein n=1 Tax=Kribbella catacumbae TaxID=460086 RepID=UPI0003AA31C3|nr:hypothetical protein [Kribbella catacumbae]